MKLKKIHYLLIKKEIKLPIIIKQMNDFKLEEMTGFLLTYLTRAEQKQSLTYYFYKNIPKSLIKYIEFPDELLRIYYNINGLILFILNCFIFDKLKTNYWFYKSILLKEKTAEIFFMIRNKEKVERSLYINFYYLTLYFLILSIFIN